MEINAPDKTKSYFLELSKEFDGNLGMTLKFLCDLHAGYYPSGHEVLEHDMEDLSNRIHTLEQSGEKTEGRKMIGGNLI